MGEVSCLGADDRTDPRVCSHRIAACGGRQGKGHRCRLEWKGQDSKHYGGLDCCHAFARHWLAEYSGDRGDRGYYGLFGR